MLLEVKNVFKSFGDKEVLKDISFKVESGKAMGFLGRNGSGKTMFVDGLANAVGQFVRGCLYLA